MCAPRGLAIVLAIAAGVGCGAPARPAVPRLEHAAYVWQRNWTPAVRAAVAAPPRGIDELRVLAAEVPADGGAPEVVAVDRVALAAAHVPITLVVRIDGARPSAGLSLAPIAQTAVELRGAGVDVIGIEVDHDCATARLDEYARWLTGQRAQLAAAAAGRWRLSITALPTWAGDAALPRLAAVVDEIVVQIHAVRAPAIFEPRQGRRDLERFARAVPSVRLRVALPTYTAVVRGVARSADPDEVGAFARRLVDEPVAGVAGIAWFRLPVASDTQTWTGATFARVVASIEATGGAIDSDEHSSGGGDHAVATRGARVTPAVRVTLEPRGDDRFDVVATNATGEAADLPAVRVAGAIDAADLVAGYRAREPGKWAPPPRSLAPGARAVIGWIRGKDLTLVD